jgi:hypothetical protein
MDNKEWFLYEISTGQVRAGRSLVPREGLEPSRPRRAPRFERGVSAHSSHLGLVDLEGLEPSHHDGPLFLRQGCLPEFHHRSLVPGGGLEPPSARWRVTF